MSIPCISIFAIFVIVGVFFVEFSQIRLAKVMRLMDGLLTSRRVNQRPGTYSTTFSFFMGEMPDYAILQIDLAFYSSGV
ncbi:hypothetical protein EYC84_011439 [Monilinia fructicola]|uniref:Uncharacterized protein n=1 Tax=Monilinia fructicola TaxID=38448 RepID=A0A5M9J596_MONFR|nr:hypothetical protein EYC84_011439 [Monilinia fructicola]